MDIWGIIVIVSILLFLSLKKISELLRNKQLSEHVSWCVNHANSSELFYYGVNNMVDPLYRLSSCDASFLDTILSAYKENLSSIFFQSRLLSDRKFVNLQSRDYFFLTLKHFLDEHECDWFFQNEKLYDTIETEYYDGDGTKETCRLTPAGLTYLKTLHLVSTYCIRNKSINSNHVTIDSINYLKESIESGTTTISRYRP